MIVGCYTLDLYCRYWEDQPRGVSAFCNTNFDWNHKIFQYTGRTRAECLREARKDGWLVNLKTRKCICPECREKYAKRK